MKLKCLNPFPLEAAMSAIRNLFALFFAVLLAFAPKSALAEQWETLKAGEFVCGQSDVYETGGVTAQEAAEASARDWDECIAKYGLNGCFVQPKGTTTAKCDYRKGVHDPMEFALASARADAVLAIFRDLRPEAGQNDAIAPTIPMVDRSVKYGYLVIMPRVGSVALTYACNNGKDDDGDGLVDRKDPGCESATDDDEWNAKPIPQGDARWNALIPIVDLNAPGPCPVTITAYWALDLKSEGGDGEYHLHHHVDHPFCPDECRTSDVSDKPGYQVLSPKGIAQAAMVHPDPVALAIAGTSGALTWTELRSHIEAPERAPGVEYVDNGGNVDDTMWYGRAADIQDRGDSIVITFKSNCDDMINAENRQEYTGLDGIAMAAGNLGVLAIGTGNRVEAYPFGGAFLEGGVEFGSPHVSFIGTAGVGHTFDNQCWQNDAWATQLRAGVATNRSEQIGMYFGGRMQYSFVPSIVVDQSGEAREALGPNSFVAMVEAGPRVAFGRGVHNGWVLPTVTSSADMRWVDGDEDGIPSRALGFDLGVGLAVGVDF